MSNFLLLLDGPKGSGKSTLSALLKSELSNTEFFSLDIERGLLERTGSLTNDNERAFAALLEKTQAALKEGKSVVIDCGDIEERLRALTTLAASVGAELHVVSLTAPYEVLMERVRERDERRGKVFDKERFDCTLEAQQAKSFENARIIDSSTLAPQEILAAVLSILRVPGEHKTLPRLPMK